MCEYTRMFEYLCLYVCVCLQIWTERLKGHRRNITLDSLPLPYMDVKAVSATSLPAQRKIDFQFYVTRSFSVKVIFQKSRNYSTLFLTQVNSFKKCLSPLTQGRCEPNWPSHPWELVQAAPGVEGAVWVHWGLLLTGLPSSWVFVLGGTGKNRFHQCWPNNRHGFSSWTNEYWTSVKAPLWRWYLIFVFQGESFVNTSRRLTLTSSSLFLFNKNQKFFQNFK